jgi:pimeloyl-ACP methyl ester carboxylesterase
MNKRMSSCSDIFLIDRQTNSQVYSLCLPGWGFDYRIMRWSDTSVNRIFVRAPFEPELAPEIAGFLKNSGIEKISILGWSLGGFAALDFAKSYPELVDDLVLIGIRRKYGLDEIELAKKQLNDAPVKFLEGFYRRCFLPAQRRDWTRFKALLMDDYIKNMDINSLSQGLDYLANARINDQDLSLRSSLIIQGEQDLVAPAHDAAELALASGAPFHLLKDASHAAFLSNDFPEVLEQWLKRK